MLWLWRGFLSAVFHYASCGPCYAVMQRRKRKREAKKEAKRRRRLQKKEPGASNQYPHPLPSETNPYWSEEITLGPGPPPRRGKRTNTGTSSQQIITPLYNNSALGSHAGSSNHLHLSDLDDPDDENWNRRRYQREDEELWGMEESTSPVIRGSSVGLGGIGRPGTSKSSTESHYTTNQKCKRRAQSPVFVSVPSARPSDNAWMLQPPPKARIMSGKERATRSRSGSGASSRVELHLQRQASARHLRQRQEGRGTPELRDAVRGMVHQQPNMRGNMFTPRSTPPEARKRRDTAMSRRDDLDGSSGSSGGDTVVRGQKAGQARDDQASPYMQPPSRQYSPFTTESAAKLTPHEASPAPSPVPSLRAPRVRSSVQRLSTVMSSGSEGLALASEQASHSPPSENQRRRQRRRQRLSSTTTQSTDSNPYLMMKHRTPLGPSDVSSLNVLQELVPARIVLGSRFASAPVPEARISLPPVDPAEEKSLSRRIDWSGSGFAVSRGWGSDVVDGQPMFTADSETETEMGMVSLTARDPRARWSNHF